MLLQKGTDPKTEQPIWLVLGNDCLPVEPIQQYLNHLVNLERSPNTIESYARWLKVYWEYLQRNKLDWRDVNIEDLSGYLRWLRIGDGNEAIRSEKTVNHAMTIVNVFYEFHTHRGNVGKDKKFTRYNLPIGTPRFKSFLSGIAKSKPTQKSLLKLKEPRRFPGCLTQQQIKALIKACNTQRDKLIIKILYETGMRKGELLGLRLEDFGDCGENEIAIVARNNRNGARVKNSAERVLNVSKEVMQAYEDYLIDEYPDIEPDFAFVNIWGGKVGEPMNYRSLNHMLKQLQKKTGIYVYPHLFRHTHATELIRAGVDIYHVSKRLGHASISTTLNEYGHLTKEDLGLLINKHAGERHLNFSSIQQSWFKEKVKKYIIYKRIQGNKFSTLLGNINIFIQISRFLEKQYINSFQEINEETIELLLAKIKHYSKSYQDKFICYFKGFLNTGNIEGWFEIPTYTLDGKCYRKGRDRAIDYIPNEVLRQLDEQLHFLPESIQRLVILIRTLGLRGCEILQLKYDCLRQRRNGNWEIEFTNWKFKDKLDRLPINSDLASLIKQQQKYIKNNLGDDFNYLFCNNKIGGQLKDKDKNLQIIYFRPASSVLKLKSLNRYLNNLSKHCDIKDKTGEQWHFTSHQFRRTVATKMTNERVRQYIIQCYLRHQSPDMLKHYAELLPDTIKQEMEEFRQKKKIVDVTGREVKQIHQELDNNIGLEWLRAKMQPKALAMGFCARPALLKPCPHANACMSCEHFRLDEGDLPALKQHLSRNQKLKKESQKLGYVRQIKAIEQDENQLVTLINSLKGSNE